MTTQPVFYSHTTLHYFPEDPEGLLILHDALAFAQLATIIIMALFVFYIEIYVEYSSLKAIFKGAYDRESNEIITNYTIILSALRLS